MVFLADEGHTMPAHRIPLKPPQTRALLRLPIDPAQRNASSVARATHGVSSRTLTGSWRDSTSLSLEICLEN